MNTSEKGKHFKSALDMNGQTKSQILHSRIHLRDKANHCYRCGKSFKVKVSLHGYFKRHKERGRPLHCDKCAESFKQKVQLQNHSSTHTKERLYNCQQDKTSFYLFIYLFIYFKACTSTRWSKTLPLQPLREVVHTIGSSVSAFEVSN